MWEDSKKLYHSDNQNSNFFLGRNKGTNMSKIDTMASYLTIITHVHDELETFGEIVEVL
jgi:hypothetical protein